MNQHCFYHFLASLGQSVLQDFFITGCWVFSIFFAFLYIFKHLCSFLCSWHKKVVFLTASPLQWLLTSLTNIFEIKNWGQALCPTTKFDAQSQKFELHLILTSMSSSYHEGDYGPRFQNFFFNPSFFVVTDTGVKHLWLQNLTQIVKIWCRWIFFVRGQTLTSGIKFGVNILMPEAIIWLPT